MSKRQNSIFWGLLLIAGGIYGLAKLSGYEITQDPEVWAFVFGGLSLISLVFYFSVGVKNWFVLFPAGIFGGLGIISAMITGGVDDPAMASPLFIGIALPFIVALIINWKANWWALIPTGVMAFLVLVLFATDRVAPEWIGFGFLFILAVTFFLVFLSRGAWWAALVAYILLITSFMPLMSLTSRPELSGVILFFAIGLPFLYVYLKSPGRRWTLFPAGVLITLGIVTALVLIPGGTNGLGTRIGNTVFYAGIAATFAVAWLKEHMRWAMIVTILAAILAVAAALFGEIQQSWPIIIILAGGYLLYQGLRPKIAKS